MKHFILKRIYDEPADNDGYRLFIDRLWARGMTKERAKLNEWNKTLAPSTELRKWFNHQPERFGTFAERYKTELRQHQRELQRIKAIAIHQTVCLLYGAKDEKHNQAVILKAVLESL